jgi:hypothetical protein
LRDAQSAYRRSIALYDVLSKEDAVSHRRDYARVLGNLAQLYGQMGRVRQADDIKRKATEMLGEANAQ